MANIVEYKRRILALNDVELELFVREWVALKKECYFEVESFGGVGDLGRDIVGFLSKDRHEGDWHNYQCKQYRTSLPTDKSILEIGKILYYAYKGEFTAPAEYIFVAPKGANRNLQSLIYNPSRFKCEILDNWDKYCGKNAIIESECIPLDKGLREFIESYDFSKISLINLDSLLLDRYVKPVLFKWFNVDPGPAPKGVVPKNIEVGELSYISKLLDAYGERDSATYSSVKDLDTNPKHLSHLIRQRERFFDADYFKRFYRDNTEQSVISEFERDIHYGVVEVAEAMHKDALSCVNAVMSKAADISPSGVVGKHAGISVKQGMCHHLANEDKLSWR